LAKESVRKRLEQADGISFTEFSYTLLQAYDFLVLHDLFFCTLQMGGSDQWGNITAGIELIRRVRGIRAHGLVFPLVTASNGIKFGKTEAGTIWLDSTLTSPFQFYQFWLNTDDRDVIGYLKAFTWLVQEEIGQLEANLHASPEHREAQRRLAQEVTSIVHGEAAAARAEQASAVLFGAEFGELTAAELLTIFGDVPSTTLSRMKLVDGSLDILNALVVAGLARSKGEARRLLEGGGIYLNNRRVSDTHLALTIDDAIDGEVTVLRRGSKRHHLIQFG
jgi:tyrosyl-tRNA synthetase